MFEKFKTHLVQSYKTAEQLLNIKRFKNDDSAVTSVAINGITGIVAIVIVLLVGALILSKLGPKIVGNDATSNTTIANIVSSGYGALDIATIIPYVIVAGVAILILMLYFMGQKAKSE